MTYTTQHFVLPLLIDGGALIPFAALAVVSAIRERARMARRAVAEIERLDQETTKSQVDPTTTTRRNTATTAHRIAVSPQSCNTAKEVSA